MRKGFSIHALWLVGLMLSGTVLASQTEGPTRVRYRKGKQIDFQSLLIEGERKRPEISIVTGNVGAKDNGLLSLRENFTDYMADDAGEEIK
ncbi:MAG: hypothetical protein H6621_00760 [Halobacteriovoraceae bacterium]|nr:hypothetical protein [Halobacteriovoraceae bacterium]MCB9093571.1 hypothetical protein [Halobacteriovoraceae bacterium]